MMENGANRVSWEAVKEVEKITRQLIVEITSDSVKLAKHANRKTIKADDIKLAI